MSAFATARVHQKLSLVGRLDRLFQPMPGSESFDYFPLSEQAPAFVGYAALDVLLAKNVHLMPNLELARYDLADDGTRPGADVMPRVSVFFTW